MRTFLSYSLLGLAVLATGCLSSSHRVGKGELMRLSNVAPEQRGDGVRVVQNLGHQEGPPRAERVRGNTVVVVHSPVWVEGRPHHHNHHATQSGGGNTVDHRASGGGGGGGGGTHAGGNSGGKSSGSSGFGNVASGKKDNAKALLILAGVAAVALAATEGARYDGWVNLHPMHPVHLYGPGGYTVLPLAHIDPQTAAWASHAYVREEEGPWTETGRAPLNRQGFTYSLIFGAGEVPVIDYNADPGFNGHIQFGYFPTKNLGLNLDIGMAWTNDANQQTIYTSRTAFELQGYLVKAGPVHAGLWGQVGVASRFDDGIGFDDNSNLVGAGANLQLDVTTRLAITGRLGSTRSFGEWANEIGLGVSIY